MKRRAIVPPAHPRERRWEPPVIGTYFERRADHAIYQVRNVYRRDGQVQLVPAQGGPSIYVYSNMLASEWREQACG